MGGGGEGVINCRLKVTGWTGERRCNKLQVESCRLDGTTQKSIIHS